LAGRYSHHHIFHRYKVQQDSFLLFVRKGKKIGLGGENCLRPIMALTSLQIGDSSTSPPRTHKRSLKLPSKDCISDI
jgi:hypothetical protein